MDLIRFTTTIGADQTIRPPQGVSLPGGEFEVTIRPVVAEPAAEVPDAMAETRAWLLSMAAEAEQIAPPLPSDMAANHDHYAHGKPLP